MRPMTYIAGGETVSAEILVIKPADFRLGGRPGLCAAHRAPHATTHKAALALAVK